MSAWIHRASDQQIVIERVAYHRNGICGNGFHAITFRQLDNTPMMGVVFEEPGNIAVFNRELAGAGNLDFYTNSWRGDEFEQALRQAVADYHTAQETLPTEAWAEGWSPMQNPIRDDSAPGEGNADRANELLSVIPALVKRKRAGR